MTDEPPKIDSDPVLSTDALDWSVSFDSHYREAFQKSCAGLPGKPDIEDFQRAATFAFISTLRESGIKDVKLIEFVGQAIWEPVKPEDDWDEDKNLRRTQLIDKMFQNDITFEERFELNSLTQLMRAAIDTEENIPMAGAEKLYSELLELDDDE